MKRKREGTERKEKWEKKEEGVRWTGSSNQPKTKRNNKNKNKHTNIERRGWLLAFVQMLFILAAARGRGNKGTSPQCTFVCISQSRNQDS
jgi:hypothetical protein